MNHPLSQIIAKFSQTFSEKPALVRAPGRVNLIGEHTDYNNGFVLPASINKYIYLAVSKRDDNKIHLISVDLNDEYISDTDSYIQHEKHWADYILGVINQFQKNNYSISGFNCVFSGDIPLGAGLSSSAALECGIAFSLNYLFGNNIDKIDMVKLSQKAENEYVGVKSGIMDQFASMMGKKEQVIKLDCQSLEYEYNPLRMDGIEIVLFNSNVKHSLVTSEYNTRRQQCETGVKMLQEKYPQVSSLRDATIAMIDEIIKPKDEIIYRRCKYVVEENTRLLEGCEDLRKGDVIAFGKKMFATHEGLSKDYEVSCEELDFLIECVKNNPDVLGARMMGGGFGGCTINLVKKNSIEKLVNTISEKYKAAMNKDITTYIAQIEDGVSLITI
ncbi:MAG: galactokinase [Arachidicoccus sp.]|nr:galactokinase [Arachidicoccus sp.]